VVGAAPGMIRPLQLLQAIEITEAAIYALMRASKADEQSTSPKFQGVADVCFGVHSGLKSDIA
jgi:hypothetical protein